MCCKTILFQLNIISLTKIATCIFFFFFFFFCMYGNIIINLCKPRVKKKNMGKNIKSYATTQVHSPGKGREALRQKVLNLSFKIRYGLTVHIIRF